MEINGISTGSAAYERTRNPQMNKEEAQPQAATQAEALAQNAQGAAAPPAKPGEAQGAGSRPAGAGQAAQTAQAAQQVTQTTTTGSDDDEAYQTIVNKANNGQQLTASELSTLRSRNPALYAKVQQAQTAREELRQQMEANPAGATKAAKQAIAALGTPAAAAEGLNAHGLKQDDAQAVLRQALNDEYRSFASRYDQVILDGAATE